MTDRCPCECHGRFGHPCNVVGGCGHLHQEEPLQQWRCRRRRRCADREKVTVHEVGKPDQHGLLPVATMRIWLGALLPDVSPQLCQECAAQLRVALVGLPDGAAALPDLLDGSGAPAGEHVSASRELPTPVRLGVDALGQAVVEETSRWDRILAGLPPLDADRQVQYGRYVMSMTCRRLLARIDELIALPSTLVLCWSPDGDARTMRELDGVDAAGRLIDLHARVLAATGIGELVHRRPAPCPRCQRRTLEQRDGSNTITCRGCGRTYTLDEYDRLCSLFAQRHELLDGITDDGVA